jgi:hypothetical protein
MLTHWERAYKFFNSKRTEAKQDFEKLGLLCYANYLHNLKSQSIISGSGSSIRSKAVDDRFYSNPYTQKLAALTIEILSKSMESASTPYSFSLSANSDLMQQFNVMVLSAYKSYNPNLDEKAFYASALTGMIQNWCYLIHEHAGKKVYEVSPGLAERLRHTELRGINSDDLRMPYASIYVMIPKSESNNLRLYNEETGWHQLEGFYLTEDPVGEDPSKPVRTWRFLFVGTAHDGTNAFDDALFHFSIELPENTPISDILSNEQRVVDDSTLIIDQKARDIFRTEWKGLFNWAMNVVMYSTWPDVEVEHFMANDEARALWNRISKLPKGRKKDDLKDRFKKLIPQNRIRLGRSITLWSPEENSSESINVRRVRTLVSGFWMRQAYGEGRSFRRWRYQPPYWRNRDSSEESNNKHVLV